MKKISVLILAAIMVFASVVTVFADGAATLIAPAPAAQPFSAATADGTALEQIEKEAAGYTYVNWSNVASTVDLYTVTVPAGTESVKLSFDSEKLCYNYAFTGEGAPSVTDADYLSGAVADDVVQSGLVTFTVPVDSQVMNYDGTTAPADGVIDFVQIQTPYDEAWNSDVLFAITFAFEKEDELIASVFSDVASDADYAAAINWAYSKGITAGMGNGKFGVGKTVTRAQLVTFVWNLAGQPESKTAVETVFYNDITADKYYTEAIDWAYRNRIIDGIEPHTFGAAMAAEHSDLVAVLAAYAGKTAEEVESAVPAGINREDVVMAIYNLFK